MRLSTLLFALCGVLFAPAVPAAPADDVKAFLEKGNARGAYELGKKHPDQLGNPAFDFYFGVAAIDSGHAGEGVLALERYIINFPDNPQARLELARGYFVLGDDLRAREEFAGVLKMNPPPAVVANVERYLDALRSRESAYRTTTGAFLEFGVGYDTNINGGVRDANIPGFGVIDPSGVKIESGFAQLTGGASITHPIAAGVALFGSISGDLRMHERRGDEFDQGSLGAAGGVSWLREKNLLRATLSFTTLELDNRRFRDITSITGEWSHQYDELQSFNAYLQFADLDYAGANDARDSELKGVGLGYRRSFVGPWQPLLSLSGSYAKESNQRNNDFLDRDIWGLRAVVALTPAPKWALSAGATYYRSDYRQDPANRRDDYYAADLTVGYALARNLSLRGELLLSRNESTIPVNEFERAVAAVKVRYEFK